MADPALNRLSASRFDWPRWSQRVSTSQALDGEIELEWLEKALEGQSIAAFWRGHQSLVVPQSYRRYPDLEIAMEQSARHGWPVRLRRSGGGVVPQGRGILNISLAFPCVEAPGDIAETLYKQFCKTLSQPLADLGITTVLQLVDGSFCDGRFNLAVLNNDANALPCKVGGTAQYWRRGKGRQAVLLHAILVVDADPVHLTSVANQFENVLQSGCHYRPSALTNVASAMNINAAETDIQHNLNQTLTELLFTAFSY